MKLPVKFFLQVPSKAMCLFRVALLGMSVGCAPVAIAQEAPSGSSSGQERWGTYAVPFAADSLWNSRPVAPVLGGFTIPKAGYAPSVSEGKYSLGAFMARADDRPMTVSGIDPRGVWDADAEEFHELTIPRWPAGVTPAEGRDGHADIVDPISGVIHSFNKLRYQDGRWQASKYAWSKLDGSGWGDPAHYFQGARAAGVPAIGGLIRSYEINDGRPYYRHALAVSLTFNALARNPAFTFPATSADTNASKENSGEIPEGALLMLPESFDAQGMANPALRKIAQTLKIYGAYVVDRNVGTPFHVFVENGSNFRLHGEKWSTAVAADLDRIRAALRPVMSAQGWVDGEGRRFVPRKNLNLLSMRGPWELQSGSARGQFNTWTQSVMFPSTPERTVQVNHSSRVLRPLHWAMPQVGTRTRLTATASGGAKIRLQVVAGEGGAPLFDSGELADGESAAFAWPAASARAVVYAISGVGQASSVRGQLVADQ